MFFDFTNLYKKLIKNFSKIAVLLTSILQTINDKALSTQTTENKRNQNTSASVSGAGSSDVGDRIGRDIENLSTAMKLSKSKNLNITKINSKMNFLIYKAKKAFTYLKKAFIKATILQHLDPKRHIYIETNASKYTIGRVFNQIILE